VLSDRPSLSVTTTTTTPINRQSKTKLSQFFARSSFANHSLKRTKSATKLERQRRQQQQQQQSQSQSQTFLP